MYIHGNIYSSWWGAWDSTDQYPAKIKNFLDRAKGKKLNIYINSGGGSLFAGMAIYNMIKRHDAETTTYIDGIAGSIASVIALASDKVVMPSNTTFFVHKPLVQNISGNADRLRDYADQLDVLQKGLMAVYEENKADGVSIEEIEAIVNKESYLTATETAKYFKIDIAEPKKQVEYVASMFDDMQDVPKFIKDQIENKNKLDLAQAQLKLLQIGEI
ncbi:head maturation protease, ClpP-related [Clostridium perfringens]|uniref:head maturation protease, ClpP-related n=1 Tax=Clostridium perfringens TaxID=1502 RepID=UPI00232D57B5|nr:head maturation protease, ClpP-related [Clostridium perfringens]MDB2049596.1 Clp protease ClpP [Clostridium perfringens]